MLLKTVGAAPKGGRQSSLPPYGKNNNMRLALLCAPALQPTCAWMSERVSELGHSVDHQSLEARDVAAAASTGHALADRWAAHRPDLVLALGWEAGLAAQIGARDCAAPVLLRLTRVVNGQDADGARLERAVVRGSSLVVVPSVGAAQRLVDRGVPRGTLRVLPEAVDRRRYADRGASSGGPDRRVGVVAPEDGRDQDVSRRLAGMPGCQAVRVSLAQPDEQLADTLRSIDVLVVEDDTDEEVAMSLRAMSCGVPVIAPDSGVMADIVADNVTGLLVSRGSLTDALRSLLSDPMRREAMGLAAVDRVRARFDVSVVGAMLERTLHEAVGSRTAIAS